ncbi:MAG: hypothetical protein B7Z62_05330 [Deltaproteobacteria bacterium 37-65-8]|nr:MAG: hypothetical protein B7Z62_05330 [Deltaproteobacteria bacterium 37-65-8]
MGPGKGGSGPGGTPECPYDGLAYAALRAGHDAIYFGPWRRIDAPPAEIRRGYHRIGRHLDASAKKGCRRTSRWTSRTGTTSSKSRFGKNRG